jgi:CBS domain-containing protein
MQLAELERPISDIIPHIFKRPVLSVSPTDSLLQAGVFLAIGPTIYADGLVVVDGQKPVGRIGGQHIIRYITQHKDRWFHSTASQFMNDGQFVVQACDPLTVALDVFRRTKFAFVPVTINGNVVTSLSIRDVLRFVTGKLDIPVEELSSRLISVKRNTSVQGALELMLQHGIRNLAVTDEGIGIRMINDRKMLEFLLSYEGRRMLASPEGLGAVGIELIEMLDPKYIKQSMPAGIAAELLSDINTPCLLHDDSIMTPWDIVMKGLFKP